MLKSFFIGFKTDVLSRDADVLEDVEEKVYTRDEYSGAVKPSVRTNGNRFCEFTRVMFYLSHIPHALI